MGACCGGGRARAPSLRPRAIANRRSDRRRLHKARRYVWAPACGPLRGGRI